MNLKNSSTIDCRGLDLNEVKVVIAETQRGAEITQRVECFPLRPFAPLG